MKNSVIKKLMAYVLVGAMVISTPITASATENSVIADAYPENQTEGNDKNSGSGSGSNSNTKPMDEEMLEKFDLEAIGLVLDKTELTLEKDGVHNSDRIQARLVFANYDPTVEEMVLAIDAEERKQINQFLRWKITPTKGVASYSLYMNTDGEQDASMVDVKAVGGGKATITAYIDKNGNREIDDDEFSASAAITVKEYITKPEQMGFELPEIMYEKHTYNLNDFVTGNVSEKITFYVKGAYAKKATVTSDGILTIKSKDKSSSEIQIAAVSEKGVNITKTATVDEGNPTKKINGVDTKPVLDMGKIKDKQNVKTVTASLDGKKGGKSTDGMTWSSKNPKIATVSYGAPVFDAKTRKYDESKTLEATITAKGVGSTTITGVTSSNKKINLKVTVNATADSIKLSYNGEETDNALIYTGKKPQLSIVSYADDGKTVISNGKTKYNWTAIASKEFDKKLAKEVKVKVGNNGKVAVPYIIYDTSEKGTVKVQAEIKGTDKKSQEVTFAVKQIYFNEKSDKVYTVAKEDGKVEELPKKGKAKTQVAVGQKAAYTAEAIVNGTTPEGFNFNDALDWSASGAGTVSDTGVITPVKGGNISLKLSYVIKKNNKPKLFTQKYTIVSMQRAESIVFKNEILAAQANDKKAEKVTVQIKQQLPKGAKDNITWKFVAGDTNGKQLSKDDMDKKIKIVKSDNKKAVFNVKSCDPGTVVKVGAFTNGGVVGYAYIYVQSTVGKPNMSSAVVKNKVELTVGGEGKQIIDTTKNSALIRKNTGYANEPVTFSVDKKSACFVSVASDGTVYGLAPGKAKVTVTSASGKKVNVTVEVKE